MPRRGLICSVRDQFIPVRSAVASLERRPNSKGVSWRLHWRYGGGRDGAQQSLTFKTEDEALAAKAAIESRRHMVRRDDPDVRDASLWTGVESQAGRRRRKREPVAAGGWIPECARCLPRFHVPARTLVNGTAVCAQHVLP